MLPEPTDRACWAWRGALAFFVLAALTGAFFRIAVASGAAYGLDLGNVRHAHSHTMYFGWVTPALMALMAWWLPRLGAGRVRGIVAVIGAAFAAALLSYLPFLLWGYTRAPIGADGFPVSVIASGLNVFAWYAFVFVYVRARRAGPPGTVPLPVRLFDLSLWFLVLATLGAWGLPAIQVLGIENPALMTALTHLFLDLFSEGWFVLGVLGLVAAEGAQRSAAARKRHDGTAARWGVRLMAAGLPFTFALAMPPSLVPPLFALLAHAGGALVAAGTLLVVAALWPGARGVLWRFALAALAVKGLAEGAYSVLPGMAWAEHPAFRVLYLHVMLLGFVSVGLVAAARTAWGRAATPGRRAFVLAVADLLVSLVPLTPLWPAAWGGRWTYVLAALLALGPALAALRMLVPRRAARAEAPHPRQPA